MSIEIITPRLILRTPTQEDAAVITAAKQEVWRDLQLWMSWAHDGEETLEATKQAFISTAVERNSLIGLCRTSGQFVVCTGMHPRDGYEGQFETGYWVAKDFLRKGYATEACNAAIRYAFNVLNVPTVFICHHEGNVPSQRIIEKLGFTKTGVREKVFARCTDGVLLDTHDYIMTDLVVLPPLEVTWRQRCP